MNSAQGLFQQYRRNLAIRHGIGEGRQSTPDAVIHVVTPSSMAAAEKLPVP
jgi:hypothetical protein